MCFLTKRGTVEVKCCLSTLHKEVQKDMKAGKEEEKNMKCHKAEDNKFKNTLLLVCREAKSGICVV